MGKTRLKLTVKRSGGTTSYVLMELWEVALARPIILKVAAMQKENQTV